MNKVITFVFSLISMASIAQSGSVPSAFSFHEQFIKTAPEEEWVSEGSISQTFHENGDLKSALIDGMFFNLYYDLSAFDSIQFYVQEGQLDSTAYFFYAQGAYSLQEFRAYTYNDGKLDRELVFAVNPQTGMRVKDRATNYFYDANDSLILKLDTFGFGPNPSVFKSVREYDANDKLVLLSDSVLGNGFYIPVRFTEIKRTNARIDTVFNDRYSNGLLSLKNRETYFYNQVEEIDSITTDQFELQNGVWMPATVTHYIIEDGRLDSLVVFDYNENTNQFQLSNMLGYHFDESQKLVRQYATFYSPFGDSIYNYYHFEYPEVVEDTGVNIVNELANETFTLFPNPTSGIIHILNGEEIEALNIYNLQGKQMLSKDGKLETNSLDLGALPNGVYMMSIETKSGMSIRKVIKR